MFDIFNRLKRGGQNNESLLGFLAHLKVMWTTYRVA